MDKVRVRFAPSPTGPLHMGGVRTALYNYLFAAKNGGDFILRIEDTDQNRFVEGAEEYIIEALKWCGISPNEGQGFGGGNFGPYKQSERKELYKEYADFLIENNLAYYAFDTAEQFDILRSEKEANGETFIYNWSNRNELNNSINLSEGDVQNKLNNGTPYVIRFKIQENEILNLKDIIRGDIQVNSNVLDDKILFKSDGMPTYHLANIVDDHLMEISHVIRGEEWLPSMPLHYLLYKAFDWKVPQFAHLPLLLKPTGKGKLSKRDGDKMGFPVFPLQWETDESTSMGYREEGYFPEAFVNLLALLGWNSGTEQELFTLEELVEKFDLQKVGKSGSRFDPEKAKWFNQQWLRLKDNSTIVDEFKNILDSKNINYKSHSLSTIVELVKERAVFVSDLWEQSSFFFEKPSEYNNQVVKKRWKGEMNENIQNIAKLFESISEFKRDIVHDTLLPFIEQNELNMGQIMNSVRLSLVGDAKGPDLFMIMELLGKTETIERLQIAAEKIVR